MATATNAQLIAGLYVAIFNRAPDPAGLAFWESVFTSGSTIYDLADGFAAHPVFASTYGGMSNEQFVASVYQKVLGAAGDANGLAYWTAKADSGISRADIVAEFVNDSLTVDLSLFTDLTSAELALAQNRQDALTNKVDVGLNFAATFGANGNLDPSTDTTTQAGLESDTAYLAAQAAIANVTASPASVATAKANIVAALATPTPAATLIGATVPVVTPTPSTPTNPAPDTAGKTLTLTTGDDTLSPTSTVEASRTTAFDDIINAPNGTLGSNDAINGGGGNDVLFFTSGAILFNALSGIQAAPAAVTPKLTSVETVVIQSLRYTELDLSASSGINRLEFNGGVSGAEVHHAGSISSLSVKNQLSGAYLYDSSVASLGLTVESAGSVSNGNVSYIYLGGAATKELNIAATHSNVFISGASALEKVTIDVTDHSAVGIGTDGLLESVIVTGTGSIDLRVDSTLAANASLTLGAGDDILDLRSALLSPGVTLSGGGGNNSIKASGATYSSIQVADRFDNLIITDELLDGSTVDVFKVGAGKSFTAAMGVAQNGTAVVTGLGANSTVTLEGDASLTHGTLAIDLAPDTLNLVLKNSYSENNDPTSTVVAVTHSVLANGVETLNVKSSGSTEIPFDGALGTVPDALVNVLTLSDDQLTTLNVDGDQAFTFTSALTQINLNTIDASANTAGVTIDVSDLSSGLAITGSATASNILTGSSAGDVLKGGSGADVIHGGGGADSMTGGGGNNIFVFASAADTRGLLAGGDTTADNMDVIADFTSGDIIQLGVQGAVYTGGGFVPYVDVPNASGTVVQLSQSTIASADTIDEVFQGIGSSFFVSGDDVVYVYEVIVDAGNLAGRYAVISDNIFGLDTNDAIIKIGGITPLSGADFTFAV